MIYDESDLGLLRFAAAVRNIPAELPRRFGGRMFSPVRVENLCRLRLLCLNRNRLSYSLTPAGAALLAAYGHPVVLEGKQPAMPKLTRRLQSAYAAALYQRAGYDVGVSKVGALARSPVYLPSAAIRQDTAASTTRVFAGVRYLGIGNGEAFASAVHFADDSFVYLTSEMRMFQSVTAGRAKERRVVYVGETYAEMAAVLTGTAAFATARRRGRGSDAVTYRMAAEKLTCPLHLLELSDTGAYLLKLIEQPDCRQRIARYALQEDYAAPPDGAWMFDAMLGGTPLIVCVDLDMTRLRAAIRYAKQNGVPAVAAVAMPRQLELLSAWCAGQHAVELYSIEPAPLHALFPLSLYEPGDAPCMPREASP